MSGSFTSDDCALCDGRGTIAPMLVYAGIDEAGYGPMLGPLCVACSVFTIADHDPDTAGPCDLWKRLNKAICRQKSDSRRRIAVDDSKKLKLANDSKAHPLRYLERAILAFHTAATESCPTCDDQLLRDLQTTIAPMPWYDSSTPLPVGQTADEVRIAASRLRKAMMEQRITCELLRCEAIDVEAFNRQTELVGSKSTINFGAVMRLADAVWNTWPAAHPRIVVDRQGGRRRYLDELLLAYPDAKVQILAESDTLSRYRLERNGSLLTISFAVEAEAKHLPVALASMTAKYVRELFMIRLNRYFRSHMPELKPTAGYTEDARRYLAEIEPLIANLAVNPEALVRRL